MRMMEERSIHSQIVPSFVIRIVQIQTSIEASKPQLLIQNRQIEMVLIRQRKDMTKLTLPLLMRGEIKLKDHILTISGEKRFEQKEENDKHLRTERTYGKFTRSFRLPENVTEDQVKASFNNGVLEITWPKKQKQNKRATL
jgi:hypothetical protein